MASDDIKDLVDALSGRDAERAEKIFNRILDTMGKIRRFSAETVEELEAQAKFESDLEKSLAKRLTGVKALRKESEAEKTLAEGMLEAARKNFEVLKQKEGVTAAELVKAQNGVALAQEELDLRKEIVRAHEDAESVGKRLGQTMFGIKGDADAALKSFRKLGAKGFMANFAKGLHEALGPLNMLIQAVNKITEAFVGGVKTLDTYYASVARGTQITQAQAEAMFDQDDGMAALGLTATDLAAAFETSYTEMAHFSQLQPEVQEELRQTAAMFEKGMGSAADFLDAVDTMSVSMPRMADGFADVGNAMQIVEEDVIAFGLAIGITGQKSISMFQRVSPRLSQFGRDAAEEFQQLAAQSRALGIEIDDLAGMAERFDTFEGAAQAAGELNAILGGAFIEPLAMTHTDSFSERIRILGDAMQASGRDIEGNRSLQLALSEALGGSLPAIRAMEQGNYELAESLWETGAAADASGTMMEDASARGAGEFATLGAELERLNAELAKPHWGAFAGTMETIVAFFETFNIWQITAMITAFGMAVWKATGFLTEKVFKITTMKGETRNLNTTMGALVDKLDALATTLESRVGPAVDSVTREQAELEAATEAATDALEAERRAADETGDELGALGDDLDTTTGGLGDLDDASGVAEGSTRSLGSAMTAAAGAAMAGFGAFTAVSQILDMLGPSAQRIIGPLLAGGGAIAAYKVFSAGLGAPAVGIALGIGAAGAAAAVKGFSSGLPAHEAGTDNLDGEPFIAGESATRSGEVVASSKPYKGGAVINNANVVAGIAALSTVGTGPTQAGGRQGGLAGPQATSRSTTAAGGENVVVLEINGREFGRAVLKAMNDNPTLQTLFSVS